MKFEMLSNDFLGNEKCCKKIKYKLITTNKLISLIYMFVTDSVSWNIIYFINIYKNQYIKTLFRYSL